MNRRLLFNLVIDLLLLITFLLLFASPLTGNVVHEIMGSLFFLLLAIHQLTHWSWYKNLAKGKYYLLRAIHTTINLLLVACVIVISVTALGISQRLFIFLPLNFGLIGSQIHIVLAYWGLIVVSLHIGLHWERLIGIVKKRLHLDQSKVISRYLLQIITVCFVIYGLYNGVKLDIGQKLTGYYLYAFWDDSQPWYEYLVCFLSVMAIFISGTYYLLKLNRSYKKTRRKKRQ